MSENIQAKNASGDSKNMIMKDEEALLLDHDYDGIQELDHPLPMWWLAIFYISIVFGAFYVGYYMTGIGPSLNDELKVAMAEIEAKKPKAPEGGIGNEAILAAAADPAKVKAGKDVFDGKCAACHGPQGGGLIGPNLTDDYWIHGNGTPADIAKVVTEGVAEKGMPPWGPVLSPDELTNVVAFIRSIHDTHPANAKEPQGQKVDSDDITKNEHN